MNKRFFLILFSSLISINAFNQAKNLDYYLQEGLHNSPLLNDYRNQINSATSDSLLIAAAKKPYVEVKSQLLYSPFYENFGYDEVITDGGNYTAVMGVSQYIFNKKEISNRYESAAIQKRSVANASKISERELIKAITSQYLTAYSGYRDYLFNKSFLELFVEENEIVKEYVKNGFGKQTDYLALNVETQSQEILVSQLKNQYRKDVLLLNQLCGLTDTSFYVLSDPHMVINGTSDITKTPSFIQFKIDSLRIENQKTAVDIRYKPKVNWFADAGVLTSKPMTFYKNFGYSAGIGLNVPVYDGRQRNIEKQKLGFEENSRQAYAYTYKNQYYNQIQQLYTELNSLNDLSARLEIQLKTTDQLLKALRDQLEAGIILMTDYIIAIKNMKNANHNLNIVNIQKFQVINEINYLMTQ